MRLGYACINTSVSDGFRSCRLKTIQKKGITYYKEIILHNLNHILDILKWNIDNSVFFYRVSSDIIPLSTHPYIRMLYHWEDDVQVLKVLKEIRTLTESNDLRLSMHPDQYTVLNSLREDVVKRSIEYLEYHAKILELIAGTDMIIHVGGVYGDKESAMNRFVSNYKKLDNRIKGYIRIENDDKSYSLKDVLALHLKTGVKVVWDYHHHRCLKEEWPSKEDIDLLRNSWGNSKMKVHISSGKRNETDRSHRDFVYFEDLLYLLSLLGDDIDIMVEAKAKEKALLKLRREYETYCLNK
jgi:UV DNA damage endonuclease